MNTDNWKMTQPTEEAASCGVLEVPGQPSHQRQFILWEMDPYRLQFELHEACSFETNQDPLFKKGDDLNRGLVANPDEDSLLVSGFVKWDGCTQFEFHNQLWHYDHKDDVPDLKGIIALVWKIAADMEHWDG